MCWGRQSGPPQMPYRRYRYQLKQWKNRFMDEERTDDWLILRTCHVYSVMPREVSLHNCFALCVFSCVDGHRWDCVFRMEPGRPCNTWQWTTKGVIFNVLRGIPTSKKCSVWGRKDELM